MSANIYEYLEAFVELPNGNVQFSIGNFFSTDFPFLMALALVRTFGVIPDHQFFNIRVGKSQLTYRLAATEYLLANVPKVVFFFFFGKYMYGSFPVLLCVEARRTHHMNCLYEARGQIASWAYAGVVLDSISKHSSESSRLVRHQH